MAVLLTSALTACSADEPVAAPVGELRLGDVHLVTPGTLTVCVREQSPFVLDQSGQPAGFDVDLTKHLAAMYDLDYQAVWADPTDLETAQSLNTRQCDVAAGAIPVSGRLHRIMDFTDPYFVSTQVVLVTADSEVEHADDLAGRTVALLSDSVGESYVREQLEPRGATITSYPDTAALIAAVTSGQAEAAIADDVRLDAYAAHHPEVAVVDGINVFQRYALATRDKHYDLTAALDRALARMRAEGEYDQLLATWLPGVQQEEEPR